MTRRKRKQSSLPELGVSTTLKEVKISSLSQRRSKRVQSIKRQELSGIFKTFFGSKGSGDYEFPVDEAMSLLEACPELIQEGFHHRSVLSYFLEALCPPSIVRQLCVWYKQEAPKHNFEEPASWEDSFEYRPNPIADACEYTAADGVMKLLCQEFPELILQGGYRSCLRRLLERMGLPEEEEAGEGPFLPIPEHERPKPWDLWRWEAPLPAPSKVLEFVEAMSRTCPQVVELLEKWHLDEAIAGRFGEETSVGLIRFVQERKTISKLRLSLSLKEDDLRRLRPMINPNLKQLEMDCFWGDVEVDALVNLLSCLEVQKPPLRKLRLLIPQHFSDDRGAGRLIRAIKATKGLMHLDLDIDEFYFDEDDSIALDWRLRDFLTEIGKNIKIETIVLTHFELVAESFWRVFPTLCRLKTLVLNKFRVASYHNWVPHPLPKNCRLQTLELDLNIGRDQLKGLIARLKDLPHLTQLKLTFNAIINQGNHDVTGEMIDLLSAGKLKILSVNMLAINFDLLAESLATNTSLQSLHICEMCSYSHARLASTKSLAKALEQHNVTLERFKVKRWARREPKDVHLQKVQYYTGLNSCGRGQLRAQDASRAILVDCLGLVRIGGRRLGDLNLRDVYFPKREPLFYLNTRYGLLRHTPTLWA